MSPITCLLCFTLCLAGAGAGVTTTTSSPYLSPTTFFKDYKNMVNSFKVFSYTPSTPITHDSTHESRFYDSLLKSSFITQEPEKAHMYFIPTSSHDSTRTHARLVAEIRAKFPYWNRALGADHFFLSCSGFSFNSDRNALELKKNSVMVSCFPTQRNMFIPHKDVTLPSFANSLAPLSAGEQSSYDYLGYVGYNWVCESSLVNELTKNREFIVESQPSDPLTYEEMLGNSKFCLFEYSNNASGIFRIGEALRFGCVPVVITDRPINDLPLMDLLRWQDIAVFLGSTQGGVNVEAIRQVLTRTWEDGSYDEMRRLGVVAGQHLLWNDSPQPYDAFHMVMYQLWRRRHVIRYTLSESELSQFLIPPPPPAPSSYTTLFNRRPSFTYDGSQAHHHHDHHLRIISESLGGPVTGSAGPFGLQAEIGKLSAQEIMDAKALAASKSHSEAERRRRERINNHLAKLRSLLPSTTKTDKASLLAEVIQHVKELKRQTTIIAETSPVPTESDELTVDTSTDEDGKFIIKASICCEDRSDLLPDLIKTLKALRLKTLKAEITTLGGRVKNVLFITTEDNMDDNDNLSVDQLPVTLSSIQEALKAVMEKSSSDNNEQTSSGSVKRQRTTNVNIHEQRRSL
ncbi:hypothetical protein ACFE04_018881 [Oxalis oulophora]